MSHHFDRFVITQWEDGYTLEVGISRPRNAPSLRVTKADRERWKAVSQKNVELVERLFPNLDAVFTEIQSLQFPMEV